MIGSPSTIIISFQFEATHKTRFVARHKTHITRQFEKDQNMTEEVKPEVAKTSAEPAAKGKAMSVSIHESASSIDGSDAPKKKRGSVSRGSSGRSSFLTRMGMSFKRSSGERGADVETLRGTSGADFEGNATIKRGDGGDGCGCFGGSKDPKDYFVLIKGPFCFVFKSVEDPSPKYAISLAFMKPVARAPSQGRSIVVLETNLGDVEYEMSFADETTAKAFKNAANHQALAGQAEQVRKRLGHEHLLTKRGSVRFAEGIALQKINDAPEKKAAYETEALVGNYMMGGPL